MSVKVKSIVFSIIWTLVILVFPITSGVIASIFKFNDIEIFLLQGSFMLLSLIVPFIYIIVKKYSLSEFGMRSIECGSLKKVLFLIPLLLIVLPRLVVGVSIESVQYVFSLLFFTIFVGISEELYFRGVILMLIKNSYESIFSVVLIPAIVFGLGHGASIIGTGNAYTTVLQIINAFFFGVVAVETLMIIKSIYPLMIFHFLYNFINHVSAAEGKTEVICIIVQVLITVITALVLFVIIRKDNSSNSEKI